jgi:hypothetical protein
LYTLFALFDWSESSGWSDIPSLELLKTQLEVFMSTQKQIEANQRNGLKGAKRFPD